MMIKQRFLLNQSAKLAVKPLEAMFEQLRAVDEVSWGLYEFSSEMLRDKIDDTSKLEIICESIACGKSWAQRLAEKFELEKFSNEKATKLAQLLGLQVNEVAKKATKLRVVFAQFITDAGGIIELAQEPLEGYQSLVLTSEALPSVTTVREVLIAHEIFHYLEEQHADIMYSRQKTVRLWKLFNYEHRSTINATSEIAAMAFAKELCLISFVPQALDVLLTYALDSDFSKSVYEDIIANIKNKKM